MTVKARSRTIATETEIADYIMQCVDIAIDPEMGSPMMIELAQSKGVKKGDIRDWNDLATHFGAVSAEEFRKSIYHTTTKWAFEWVKKSPHRSTPLVETGGTTGKPKKTVFLEDMTLLPGDLNAYDIEMPTYPTANQTALEMLDAHGIERNLNVLCMLPTGPHMAGKWVIKYWDRDTKGMVYHIDLDPRFIKAAMMKNPEAAQLYLENMNFQVQNLIEQEFANIGIVITTGVIIEKMYPVIQKMKENGNLKAVIHGGVPMSQETHRLIREELGLPLAGYYGQSLFGPTMQSELPNENYDLDYYPWERMNMFITKDEKDISQRGDYGEEGTVVSQRVSPECVIPALVQSGDYGMLIKGKGIYSHRDGIRNPRRILKKDEQLGVY
ncbi:MAG: hypothetical protein ACTSQE_11640 [Candidatus Heimdallarchaeaceae archaeon]